MIKRIAQFFCRHKYPAVHFAIHEYIKVYTCPKCGKKKTVNISDKPEYVKVLPTDYYAHQQSLIKIYDEKIDDTNKSDD